jgi:hypothetical protein
MPTGIGQHYGDYVASALLLLRTIARGAARRCRCIKAVARPDANMLRAINTVGGDARVALHRLRAPRPGWSQS